ncbi:MAG: hypothetical protein Unbinned4139contig1000_22 [Prokaryotic dsDNA virus sp.]|nr:MAG: hypothetical protein Unbinned4139contig1000_22 [Prokaryotic dsDNA virus sp.]|tara:strand:+ start:11034 stop:11831 length:798 start_codon:yes stop_codon:yes gene_type:complete
MPTFQNTAFADFYKRIFQINQTSNTGVDATERTLQTGDGVDTPVSIGTRSVGITPASDTVAVMNVTNAGGDSVLKVDGTNKKVLVNEGQVAANTQYVYFGANYPDISNFAANTHYPIPFAMGGMSGTNDVDFGTGTDPDDSFTTADTDTQYASQIVPMIWMPPDDITISSAKAIIGADAATGDTHRMHIKSFDFTSGSTSCLSNGALVAHSSSDTTNAGNEQAYTSAFTIDSADVDADKAILCFFRSDSVNSDYSITVIIKYFIR